MENQLAQEFLVTYLDADCGRINSEIFGSLKEAERFASRNCGTEESWAVIDAVAVGQARIAA
ncbi:hypothetical protein AHiyo4_07870 [Arthrobacter sp. Hiyo4]|nr:hypothetical protein AHiyo4_07870 [Arthrobacter sp. Hiyo4]